MNITAKIIKGIKYKSRLSADLEVINLGDFDINTSKSSCMIKSGQNSFAVSKWVSPKRTRSYPYERVYNTLSASKKITVIPVVKDEGAKGDRDFLQWDTISLMSLLDVYVILAYYDEAEKHPTRENKITNQKFDKEFIVKKIREIEEYHSSALHWNLAELSSLSSILEQIQNSYNNISEYTGVKFHSSRGLENFINNNPSLNFYTLNDIEKSNFIE